MYYHYNMEITMKSVIKYLDVPEISKVLAQMQEEQQELTRKKNVLRQRIHRIRKLIESHNQLALPLEEN